MTEVALFGADGKPALHKEGHAVVRRTFDNRGNMTELALFDVDGKPALHKDGYSVVRK